MFYKQAHELVINNKVDDLDSIKLSIFLNYSVFCYEILSMRIYAICLAQEGLVKAITKLKEFSEEELADENLKESLTIIEIMSQNLNQWNDEEQEQNEKEETQIKTK
jgi:hypothetical protein